MSEPVKPNGSEVKWSELPDRGVRDPNSWEYSGGRYNTYDADRCQDLWLYECTLCYILTDTPDQHTKWHKEQGF